MKLVKHQKLKDLENKENYRVSKAECNEVFNRIVRDERGMLVGNSLAEPHMLLWEIRILSRIKKSKI